MSFHYDSGRLMVEEVALSTIGARFGTPCFVYSRAAIESNLRAFQRGFGHRRHRICYAVKANGNLAILDLLARQGCDFDIVSGGELARVEAAGGEARRVTFAGVGKTRAEMQAALDADIACFNVESLQELELLDAVASAAGKRARIAVRVNPDVDAKTHPYISTGLSENKFGVPMASAVAVYRQAAQLSGIEISGVACHIGSQLSTIEPIVDAAERILRLVGELEGAGIDIEHIDIGGGLGIQYGDETPPPIEDYVRAICEVIPQRFEIVIEPGRSVVGPCGVLLTEVLYLKEAPTKTFAVCDAAMTELIRPALYQAQHRILPVVPGDRPLRVDVVGPVCETADFLARDRDLAVARGALLAVMDCGAYGSVMASNYNARPRAAEILVDGADLHLIRERESVERLWADEHRLPAN